MNRLYFSLLALGIAMLGSGSSLSPRLPSKAAAMQYQDIYLEGKKISAIDYIINIFMHADLRGGGEEESDLCDPPIYSFTEFHGTVYGAFETLQIYTKQFTWSYEDRIVWFRVGSERPSLLDAEIKRFEFKPDEDPVLIGGRLFELDEVERRRKDIAIKHWPWHNETRFAYSRAPHEPETPVVLENMSVREALREIVKKHDHHLSWIHKQYVCDGQYYYRFNWISR